LQGSNDRFYQNTNYNSPSWITLLTGTLTATSGYASFTLNNTAATVEAPKLSYRILASGGTGIINWAIPGLYVDYYAMGVGTNASDTNGNIGQLSIQNVRNLTLSGGNITVNQGTDPLENIKANHTWIG
jgi:hypothetical protein